MRRWIGVVAVAAAVLAACTTQEVSRSPDPAGGSGHPATASESPARLDCDRPPRATVHGEPVVPAGAVAARLCGGQVDNAGFNLAWPADTLRGRDAAALATLLNRLEPYARPTVCTLPLSPGFDLVLAYPDGGRVWVHGDPSGSCAYVQVQGGRLWAGASRVLRSTLALVESHRAQAGTSVPRAGPRCPRTWNAVSYTAGAGPVRPGDAVAVTACRYRLDRPAPGTITQSADGRLVGESSVGNPAPLVRGVARGSLRDPCGGVAYDLSRTQDVLLVRDGYGDLQVVSTTSCWASDLTGRRRYPSRDLVRRVEGLLSRAG